MKTAILITLAAFLAHSTLLIAEPVADQHYRTLLAAVRPTELPAMSAKLVKLEQGEAQGPATVGVVNAASEINPAAVLSVVGAISRGTPKMASVAAATAAENQPRFAWAFARTAALAAPEQASDIVYAVASAVPKEAQAVATAVAQAVPESSTPVISALGRAMPALQPFLDEAMLLAENRTVSATTIIAQANRLMAAAPITKTEPMPELSAPTQPPKPGPPFVNPPGNPDHVVPGPPFEVPPGWQRKYSKPK
ncbi:MAG: hypothetical protein KJ072_10580 [Verrucomicrobia bacterium]|nr:hypothetical protein [Verrucomicrobiota bacterium]